MGAFRTRLVFSIFALGTTAVLAAGNLEYEDYFKKILELHNHYREKHGVNPLELNATLSKDAAEYMEAWIALEEMGDPMPFGYRDSLNYLYQVTEDENDTMTSIIKSWYKQGENYDYTKEHVDVHPPCNYFTQMIWKSTTHMGLAIEERFNKTWVLATYFPTGNVLGSYLENVFEPKTVED